MEENFHTVENENLSNITPETENNLSNYCFMFIDAQLKDNACQDLLDNLRKITDQHILTFDNIDAIYQSDQINSTIKIFLILSGSLEPTWETQLDKITNIEFIYVFTKCKKWRRDVPKIRGIFNDKDQLFAMISHDIKGFANPWTFNNERSFLRASSYDNRWYHLFIKTLSYLSYTATDWNKMLDECRSHYKKNSVMLTKIDEFSEVYTRERAINFYTQDNFIYRIFNSALRTHNMDTISKLYPFIRDLHEQLYERYRKYWSILKSENIKSQPLRIVYRGQYLRPVELEKLRSLCRSRQSDVLLNMFGSTTRDSQLAMSFIVSDHPENVSCLFQIIIPDYYYDKKTSATIHPSQMFLDVSNLSAMPCEQEVLFSVMSRFRVKYVGYPTKNRSWIPIILEFYQDYLGFDPHWHKIRNMVYRESDEMKRELFELVLKNANKPINWDIWWQRLIDEFGARRRDCEPFVVTLCECFGDPESLMKAIELRKRDLQNNSKWKEFSDPIFVMNEMQYGKPTRIIVLYELFLRKMNFSELDTDGVIQSLKRAGDAYAECGCFYQNALECYEKALQLAGNHSDRKIISEIRIGIKKLAPGRQSVRSKKRQEICQMKLTDSLSNTNLSSKTLNYESEHLQWFVFWQLHKVSLSGPKDRLEHLSWFLKKQEEWMDSADLRIFFDLPFQRNQNVESPENIIYPYFYSSIWSYLYKNTACFQNHSLNKWHYEKFINEWLTLSDLKRIITSNVFNKYKTVTAILTTLERILRKLSLIITMLTFVITTSPASDGLHIMFNPEQIEFQTDACIHPKKLVFFDIDEEAMQNTV
ncbi:unnamed protein product [Adineta ricciae]|uniref:Uncharacterized protein n=1 Tax=Adineta ricciae TaxID=249248 RepID=A0A815A2J8_ADIRI|nr:unnamed protein product [Adineta ricciae]CAF1251509.1 unnamed protein product [Adineta ricciae]